MEPADLILYNAQVHTLERSQPRAQLVAARRGRIIFVGTNESLGELRGPRTRLIDCQGHTMLPGLIDAHLHLFAYASSLLAVDCSPRSVRSLGELKASLRRRAETRPQGAWVRGTGYDEFFLKEKRHPSRFDLDEGAPVHPVKLTHRSGHAVLLNSLALKLVGVTRDTPDPVDGVIDRDPESGEPTGLLLEMDQWLEQRLPSLSSQELEQAMGAASRSLLAQGITSVHDASPDPSMERFERLDKLRQGGVFLPRVYKMLGFPALQGLMARAPRSGEGDEHLRLGAVKFMLQETTGALQPPLEVLAGQALEASMAGFQLAFHVVEPGILEAAIQALEHCARQGTLLRRPRLEHCSLCPPPLLERLKGLGALIVSNPPFLYHSGERYLSEVPIEQRPWLYRFRSFFRSGLRPAAGSDAPVTPPSPLRSIQTALSRRAEEGSVLQVGERVTFQQALSMHALNGAYAAFEEGEKGSLAPGKLADMVVLDRRLERYQEDLEKTNVLFTVLGGEVYPGEKKR